MAVRSLTTTTGLAAVVYSGSPAVLLPADLASIASGIKQDPNFKNSMNQGRAVLGKAFDFNGLLFLPSNRASGGIQVFPGDVVAIDVAGTNVGWPIIVSADAIANGSWTLV